MTYLGWTWEYIDDYMTMPRLTALMRVWEEDPPVQVTVARLAGVKSKPRSGRRAATTAKDMEAAMHEATAFGFQGAKVKRSEGVNAEVAEADRLFAELDALFKKESA